MDVGTDVQEKYSWAWLDLFYKDKPVIQFLFVLVPCVVSDAETMTSAILMRSMTEEEQLWATVSFDLRVWFESSECIKLDKFTAGTRTGRERNQGPVYSGNMDADSKAFEYNI